MCLREEGTQDLLRLPVRSNEGLEKSYGVLVRECLSDTRP